MQVICIHGFLGQASDWDFLFPENEYLNIKIKKIPLFSKQEALPAVTLSEWGRWLNQYARSSNTQNILVGYSLGGRIALQALCTEPTLWKKAILISAHPGFSQNAPNYKNLLQERLHSDEQWAKQWRFDPWEKVLAAWNSQSVFQEDQKSFFRNQKDYDREKLAQILIGCSLGHQKDWRATLSNQLQCPVLWVSGEKDERFTTLARELAQASSWIQSVVLPEAGHRVWVDQPVLLKKILQKFLLA